MLSIAKLIGADESTLRHWIHAFKAQGPEALKPHNNNQRYSKEFKLKCVAAYLRGIKTTSNRSRVTIKLKYKNNLTLYNKGTKHLLKMALHRRWG